MQKGAGTQRVFICDAHTLDASLHAVCASDFVPFHAFLRPASDALLTR